MIPHEIWAILGIGVVGYISNSILQDLGQGRLQTALNVILTLAGAVIGIKFFGEGLEKVRSVVSRW